MTLVSLLPIDKLKTTLSSLRGAKTDKQGCLSPMPLRVAPTDNGFYEVLDGFKRLERWKSEGIKEIPVVVEPEFGLAMKTVILSANAPPRTISAMDEARVVHSLVKEDELSQTATAKLLGRKKTWVTRRLMLAHRLATPLQEKLDQGTINLSVACELCALKKDEQLRVSEVILRHSFNTREAGLLITAYRSSSDEASRRELLRHPHDLLPEPLEEGASPLGDEASQREKLMEELAQALEVFPLVPLVSGYSPPEKRVLEARHRQLAEKIISLAQSLKEAKDADSRTDRRDKNPGPEHVPEGYRPPDRLQSQNHLQDSGTSNREGAPDRQSRLQTGALQGSDKKEGQRRTFCPQNPKRDTGVGILRRENHSGRLHQDHSPRLRPVTQNLPQVRDAASPGSPSGLEPLPCASGR